MRLAHLSKLDKNRLLPVVNHCGVVKLAIKNMGERELRPPRGV